MIYKAGYTGKLFIILLLAKNLLLIAYGLLTAYRLTD